MLSADYNQHDQAPQRGPLTRVDGLPGRRTLRSTSANRLVVPPVTVNSRQPSLCGCGSTHLEYIGCQWRDFVDFCRHLVGKNSEKCVSMCVTVVALKYVLLASQWSYGRFRKLIGSILFYWHDILTRRIMSCYTHKMAIVSWPRTIVRRCCDCTASSAPTTNLQTRDRPLQIVASSHPPKFSRTVDTLWSIDFLKN